MAGWIHGEITEQKKLDLFCLQTITIGPIDRDYCYVYLIVHTTVVRCHQDHDGRPTWQAGFPRARWQSLFVHDQISTFPFFLFIYVFNLLPFSTVFDRYVQSGSIGFTA
jgi:hypothetical protein